MHLCRSILLIATCAVSLTAGDAELALTSGRTVRGEVVTDAPASITLRMRSPVRGGIKQVEVTYTKADVLKRNDVPSPQQLYSERKGRTPDTIPELCTLAQWCYENCLREAAQVHALRVLALDPENAWAKRILDNCGYIEIDGKWVDEAEYMKANGLAKVDGQLVPIAVAEARKGLARAVATRDRCSKLVADLKAAITEKSGAASVSEAKAKSLGNAADAAKKSLDDLTAKLEDLRAKSDATDTRRAAMIAQLEKRSAEQQDQLTNATRAAAEAKRTAARDKTGSEQAKTSLPDAEAALAKAEEEVKAAAAKLPEGDTAAKAALAGPAKSTKPAPTVPPAPPAPEAKKPHKPAGGGGPGGKPPKDE